jgi:uncharacterized protein YcbX
MHSAAPAPKLSRIRIYPIKSLEPVEVPSACIGPNGGLELDRAWALYASDGRWVNGKRTKAVDGIYAKFTPGLHSLTLSVRPGHAGPVPIQLNFPADTAGAEEWFTQYFGETVTVQYAEAGFPDDDQAPGPTIVSTASLEMVCDWFPGISMESARLRFRATLEFGRMQAFEEDRLFAAVPGDSLKFSIGEVNLEGSNPCARCPVPPRDPDTGEVTVDFQKRFADLRRANLPAWSPVARFDHFYKFSTNTRVPSSEIGKVIRVGDELTFS